MVKETVKISIGQYYKQIGREDREFMLTSLPTGIGLICTKSIGAAQGRLWKEPVRVRDETNINSVEWERITGGLVSFQPM